MIELFPAHLLPAQKPIGHMARRTLTRGAAWTAPVIAFASTAPAYASSPIPCPSIPAGSSWTTTTTGTLGSAGSGGYGWNGSNKFNVYRDNGSSIATLTLASSTTISVVPGAVYSISFRFFWGYGNGAATQSTEGTFSILLDGVVQKSLTTRTAAVDANQSVSGVQPGTTTHAFTYTVPAGMTSLALTYRYIITPRTLAANDDIIVDPLVFNSCTAR
jgi:hypothetical protein